MLEKRSLLERLIATSFIAIAALTAMLLAGSTDAGAASGGRHDGITAVSGIVAAQDLGRASCSARRRSLEGRDYVASMSPTQHHHPWSLVKLASTRRRLMHAWLNVRPRVIASKNKETRAAAAKFAEDVETNIHQLQRQLRTGSFRFEAQRGVLAKGKRRPGTPNKPPRPIVVAPVVNRIVHRAILDVCQSNEKIFARYLGAIPSVIATPTSVGGLPDRGVPEAIDIISKALGEGARFFVRSDIKKFFQTIPKTEVEAFLRKNITDERFVDLFMEALATELENESEVRELLHLFPRGPIGVPQGSALSVLCANIVLADFDRELNDKGITTVRYLDDFVILGRNQQSVTKAWNRAQQILHSIDMECHDPSLGTGKAAKGPINSGFDFLSFRIDGIDVYPTKAARDEFLEDLRRVFRESRNAITSIGEEPRRAEPRFVQFLDLMDRKIRGWGDAFRATTKRVVLAQLDAEIDRLLAQSMTWFGRVRKNQSTVRQRRLMGVGLLNDTPVLNKPEL
jgi:RNA-directed DNA polymerase